METLSPGICSHEAAASIINGFTFALIVNQKAHAQH